MSQSGTGDASMTPLSNNPIQMQNVLAGTGSLPPVTQAGLPINTSVAPIELQQITGGPAPTPPGAPRLDSTTQTILSALGGAGAGSAARSAVEAMQAAQRGAPTAAYGHGSDMGQQVTQLLRLIKIFGGAPPG